MVVHSEAGSPELTAKVAVSSFVIIGICFGMPAILASIAIVARVSGWQEWLPIFGGDGLLVASAYAWLGAFRLKIRNGTLQYVTLFRSNSVDLDQIRKVRHVLEYNPWAHWGEPRDRLEIYTQEGVVRHTFSINLKVFSRNDVTYLLRLFKSKM